MRRCYAGAVGMLAAVISAHASAQAFVNGGISFADGFRTTGTTTSIVSQLVNIEVSTPTLAVNCTGTFGSNPCSPFVGPFASDFVIGGPPQVLFQWNGFTFQVTNFGTPQITPLVCDANNQCTDGQRFDGTGIVSGNGFAPTEILISWTATGNCTRAAGAGNVCSSNVTASWASSITATGINPPPPPPPPPPNGEAIPTLSEWGLMLLIASMALLYVVIGRRRE